ncbi:hypothetical protein BST29_06890 [Mycobacterium malmoense]|uniref:PE-PGRS family protein n=2 Tax=Mycobacterium malmoense TaxID=1780 RepID=A0ABX3SUJ9_MYCMA|nr:hypothetical protein BST29_06890 [Mycobacterium malmoense]
MVVDLAARPHITAGVALASAAVIAAAPMAQHLPDPHLAQQLRQVSVSNIQLTGAADSVVDLLAGVESELASLARGSAAAAVPAAALTDFLNPAALPLPIATWVNTFQTAGTNLQTIYNTFSKLPFPLLQQVAANGVSYADLYVGAYQSAAQGAVTYFTGTAPGYFGPTIQTMLGDLASSNVAGAIDQVYQLFETPFIMIGDPLEGILKIPGYVATNFAAFLTKLLTTGVANFGRYGLLSLPAAVEQGFGTSLQAVVNSWGAGDPLGAVTNLLNVPGATVNAFLNGFGPADAGLLSTQYSGFVNQLFVSLPKAIAKAMVAPGAANITANGNVGFAALQTAFQGFVNQLTNGWPSLTPIVTSVSGGLTSLLQSIPSVLSNLPSMLSNFGGLLASNIGLLISNLLKLL